jgi:hypothetical protein
MFEDMEEAATGVYRSAPTSGVSKRVALSPVVVVVVVTSPLT